MAPRKKTTRKKTTRRKAPARKKKSKSRVNEAGNYTKPTMRKRLFNRIKAGSKGGAPGQWSARKAQMLVLTNMLGKIIAELDDVKAMIMESTFEDFVGEEE